jgi:hypothetical protein
MEGEMAGERHPLEDLLAALVAALQDAEAPSEPYAARVFILPEADLVPEEALAPFYGVVAGESATEDQSPDSDVEAYDLTVYAFADLSGPEPATGMLGLDPLDPYAPIARRGVLGLLQAARATLRGKGLGTWQWGNLVGETACQTVVGGLDAEGRPTKLYLRRGLKLKYRRESTY